MAFSFSQTHLIPPLLLLPSLNIHNPRFLSPPQFHKTQSLLKLNKQPFTLSRSYSEPSSATATYPDDDFSETTSSEDEEEIDSRYPEMASSSSGGFPPPLLKKRKRYRKEYPGESKGITEEMRFVAMRLRNSKGSRRLGADSDVSDEVDGGDGSSWEPTLEGFLRYLVDSKAVFDTIERVVENSNDVSYAYFRRTGLERSECLARDIEWFGHQNMSIPEASNPGVSYATYLKELSEKSAPLFLCHFYNIYFSHMAGGQVIAKQVAEKLLGEKELEFYKWDRDAQELLKDVREKLNTLGEHWSRDDKNKCLKEATKSFRYMGQIVRLIIL